MILVRGGSGLETFPSNVASIPVVIIGTPTATLPPTSWPEGERALEVDERSVSDGSHDRPHRDHLQRAAVSARPGPSGRDPADVDPSRS